MDLSVRPYGPDLQHRTAQVIAYPFDPWRGITMVPILHWQIHRGGVPMTIPRSRIREGFSAGLAYTLVAYGLAAGALLLILLLSQGDAKPVTYAHGANSFTDLVALAAVSEPALLALLGTGLLSAYLALRLRRRAPGCQIHQIDERRPTSRADGEHRLVTLILNGPSAQNLSPAHQTRGGHR